MSGGTNNFREWIAVSNVIPIIITLISVGLSIGYFTSEVKLQIQDVGNQVTLTNQKLDALAVTLEKHENTSEAATKDFNTLELAVNTLKIQVASLLQRSN